MQLSVTCLNRPILAIVLNLIIIIFGIIGYLKMQVRAAPKIDFPVITINAFYNGASSKYMENNIVKPIENAIKSIGKVEYTQSSSYNSQAIINIFFRLNTNLDEIITDIKSVVADLSYVFPDDMRLPSVSKMSVDKFPWMWFLVNSNKLNNLELTTIINDRIAPKFNSLPSVGGINLVGDQYMEVMIEPKPEKLFGYKISPTDIERAIIIQNKDFPAGTLETNYFNFIMQMNNSIKKPEDFYNILLFSGENMIKLDQIANVKIGPSELKSIVRYNGEISIGFSLIGQSESNVIRMSDETKEIVPGLKSELSNLGVNLISGYDSSISLRESVYAVFRTIVEALILVSIVTYLFLGSWRISFIPFIAIPISLIGTFACMYFFGFTINTFTMLALVLGIGLVVDDAIVMLENVYSNCEKRKKNFQPENNQEAARESVQEISYAIIVMTLTLAAVFLPIGFIDDFLGKLFIEFAWTLAFAVIISGFVSLTLTPMLSAKIIKLDLKPNFVIAKFNNFIISLTNSYIGKLDNILKYHKFKLAFIIVASLIITMFLFRKTEKIADPLEDNGFMFVNFNTQDGVGLEYLDEQVAKIAKDVKSVEGVETFLTSSSINRGFGITILKPWNMRKKTQEEIRIELNNKFSNLTNINVNFSNPPSNISGPISNDVEFNIQALTDNIESISNLSDEIVQELKDTNLFTYVNTDLNKSMPLINLNVNKEKALYYQVPLESIGNTIQYLLSGKTIEDFIYNGQTYNVKMLFEKDNRDSISDLSKIYVKSQNNEMISLMNFIEIQEDVDINSRKHYNMRPSITIFADLAEGVKISDAIKTIDKIKKDKIDSLKVKLEYLGNIKRMQQVNDSILIAFLLGFLFIYLILAAQFESFKNSALILFTVPFSIFGGLLFVILSGMTFNIYSGIGLITLIGLVTKNAIMIIDFTVKQVESGISEYIALINSCKNRFRPILMTNISTIIGAIPLILASGPGAQARISIGIIIIGGLLIGTIFSLFIVPYIYLITHKGAKEDMLLNNINIS
ncbi:MAG: efflux RND transporter permease subunit [Rickettsiales bacterium]